MIQIQSPEVQKVTSFPGSACWLINLDVQLLRSLASTYVPGPFGPGPLIILKNILNQIRFRTKSILLQDHIANMLLDQYAFQIWSWSIFKGILSDYECQVQAGR